MRKMAFISVDMQNDFCEGGSLAIDGGSAAVERFAGAIGNWTDEDHLLFTRDWHNPPPDTNGGHFSDEPNYEGTWPVHCVAETKGAEFHPAIAALATDESRVFSKGQGSPDYSGFQGINADGVSLFDYLVENDYETLAVFGLAGDYCVLQTVRNAVQLGFKVYTIDEWTASVGGDPANQALANECASLQGLTNGTSL